MKTNHTIVNVAADLLISVYRYAGGLRIAPLVLATRHQVGWITEDPRIQITSAHILLPCH